MYNEICMKRLDAKNWEGEENTKVRYQENGKTNWFGPELKQATGRPICIQACPRIILVMKTKREGNTNSGNHCPKIYICSACKSNEIVLTSSSLQAIFEFEC